MQKTAGNTTIHKLNEKFKRQNKELERQLKMKRNVGYEWKSVQSRNCNREKANSSFLRTKLSKERNKKTGKQIFARKILDSNQKLNDYIRTVHSDSDERQTPSPR